MVTVLEEKLETGEGRYLQLEGKRALVTGASRGIGRAIALKLASEGVDIVLNYHTSAESVSEAARTVELEGEETWVYPADVSKLDDVRDMKESIQENFGKIDILVNNAGINRDVFFSKMGYEDWDKVLKVDLYGVYNCTKMFLDDIIEGGGGRIINISSVVGETGNLGQVNYASSKAGVIGFTRALARELVRYDATVNAICPGFIETEMVKNIPEEVQEKIKKRIPMSRFGSPEEVADVVAFIASPRASYITGSVIDVNGGYYI